MQKHLWEYLLVFHSRSRLPAFKTRKVVSCLFYLLCVKVRPLDNVCVEVEGVRSEMSAVNVSDNKHTRRRVVLLSSSVAGHWPGLHDGASIYSSRYLQFWI